ncbi:aa3-type cytochrome c oxidase subunit IV [Pseudochrobactrum sp. HB0163]|uniref:aa3-type cytochrome c oxidase subunit IV n=1 Tax=Pseudochrobactrum sp. HB0163 TaxID=3450708 RepID=UPI003F6E4407
MSRIPHGSAEMGMGAPMDYPEHERTYQGFTKLVKWGIITLCAVLISMAFAFFAAGWFSGLILFVLIIAAAFFLA